MIPVIPHTKRDSKLKNEHTYMYMYMQLKNFICSCVHVLKWQGKVQMLHVLLLTLNRTCLSLTIQPVIIPTDCMPAVGAWSTWLLQQECIHVCLAFVQCLELNEFIAHCGLHYYYYYLQNLSGIDTLLLFSDSCPGRNKNYTIIHYLYSLVKMGLFQQS